MYFVQKYRAQKYRAQKYRTQKYRAQKYTYLLTYSMVRSPSSEANWFAASQEIPRISRNPRVHYRIHKRPPTVSILGQPNPVHILTSYLLEIRPNIINPSRPRAQKQKSALEGEFSRNKIPPYMVLQLLPGLGLPHKTPPFIPIFSSSSPFQKQYKL